MPEFYIIFARNINKMPDFFMAFARKVNKISEFHMHDFCPKNARILRNNCTINNSDFFGGRVWGHDVPPYHPISYAYA